MESDVAPGKNRPDKPIPETSHVVYVQLCPIGMFSAADSLCCPCMGSTGEYQQKDKGGGTVKDVFWCRIDGNPCFFLIFGTPIAVAVGLATVLGMLTAGDVHALPAVTQKMFTSLDSFPLLALPLFTLSGELMEISGISNRLVKFMKMCFRKLPAASACITTISSTFFGAISGSAPATAAAIGGIMIEPMQDAGYQGSDAAAINASSASLGIIIPPSIPMVVFATTASVSVGSLFMSGVIPGIILTGSFCVMHMFRYGKIEARSTERLSAREAVETFFDAIFALGMPVIILGGIYGGFFTPTEAAADLRR